MYLPIVGTYPYYPLEAGTGRNDVAYLDLNREGNYLHVTCIFINELEVQV